MMRLFLVLCCWVTYAYACKPCIYREFQNTISCVNKNVTGLPTLDTTDWIKHVDILDTGIKNTDMLKQWQNVESVDIRNNAERVLRLPMSTSVATRMDTIRLSATSPAK